MTTSEFRSAAVTTLEDDIAALKPQTARDREVAHYVAAFARLSEQPLWKVITEQGQFWTPAPKPKDVPAGKPKQCFDNAFRLASSRDGLRYVEGWALGFIPVHHAWCVDADGRVIDNTWQAHGFMGASYFGMSVAIDIVQRARLNGCASAFYGAHGLILCNDCGTWNTT